MIGDDICGLDQPSRRVALRLLAVSALSSLPGCCLNRRLAKPTIPNDVPAVGTPLMPAVTKSSAAPKFCIDTHAHFFNGTDVPVKGYLDGPVAHSLKEPLRSLLRSLAPLADELVKLAPTASVEYNDLLTKSGRSLLGGEPITPVDALRTAAVLDERALLSRNFYRVVRNSEFEKRYNAIKRAQRTEVKSLLRSHETSLLNPDSLFLAVNSGVTVNTKSLTIIESTMIDSEPYADGVLAFIGHMLSPRWHNLLSYSDAYSSGPNAFGIDHVLGSLVDFDSWLDCPPRSAHDDQVKLHQLLSALTGGYMRPLVAYNPWTDIVTGGQSLARVRDAVGNRGFVGVKIYPPNGFYPYGNVSRRGSPSIGPSFAELDRVLEKLWETTEELDVPVMAHTNDSSGKNHDFDQLGGPAGWIALLKRFDGKGAPRINFGHLGGDGGGNEWTQDFAALMAGRNGDRIYGDTGYWSGLRCRDESAASCMDAKGRLVSALQRPEVSKRIMYGTDWFMLSRERDWANYPFEMARAIQGMPLDAADFFGLNAQRCFPAAKL